MFNVVYGKPKKQTTGVGTIEKLSEVKETEYYDVLGVNPLSSQEEICKAYYLKARQVHPDKKLDDPHAVERFQVLGEAYQVLSDPLQRGAYNRNGKHSVSRDSMLDATELFALLFGSELFEDYIGHLILASVVSSELASESDNILELIETWEYFQRKREERLAELLKDFLDQYVYGDKEGFLRRAEYEARRLSDAAFGVKMLYTIGNMYTWVSTQELRKTTMNLVQYWKPQPVLGKGAPLLIQMQEDVQRKLGKSGLANDVKSHIRLNKDTFVSHVRRMHVLDIDLTVLHVCQMVLHERNVRKEDLKSRAIALKLLGMIFKREKVYGGAESSKKIAIPDITNDDDSSEDDSPYTYSKLLAQVFGGLFGCPDTACV